MAVEAGDIIRVAARHEWLSTEDVVNVYHFEVFTPPTGGNVAAFVEDVAEHLSGAYEIIDGIIDDGLLPLDIDVYNITQDVPYGKTTFIAPYTGGAATGDALPPQDAALLIWPTDVKRRIGRTYIGVLSEASQNAGILTGGTISTLLTFMTFIRESVDLANASDIRLVVYSRSEGERTLPTAQRVQPLVATQRRRKRGRGS